MKIGDATAQELPGPCPQNSLAGKAGINQAIAKSMVNTRCRMQQEHLAGGPHPGLESEGLLEEMLSYGEETADFH